MGKPTPKRPKGNAGRCTKESSKRVYAKKRKCPNKKRKTVAESGVPEVDSTVVIEEQVPDFAIDNLEPDVDGQGPDLPPDITASASKVVDIEHETIPSVDDMIFGFRLMDMSILAGVMNLL